MTSNRPPAGGTPLPDPTAALAARVDELEQTARKAAVDAGGSRWYHYDHSYDVHAEPYGNPVAIGPHGCGLFDTGTHIAGQDPHAVMTLCRELRGLIRDYDRAAEIARRASQQVEQAPRKPPPADPTVWPEPIMVTGAAKSSRRPPDTKDTATGCIARGAGDRVVDQTRGYAAGIHHALAVLLAALTPPDRTIDENGHASE